MSDFPDTQYVDFPSLHAPKCPSKCFPQPLGSAKKRRHIIKLFGWVAPTEGTAATQDKTSQGTAVTQDIRLQVEKYYRLSHGDCAPTRNETPNLFSAYLIRLVWGSPDHFLPQLQMWCWTPLDTRDEGERHMHTTTTGMGYRNVSRGRRDRDTCTPRQKTGFTCQRHGLYMSETHEHDNNKEPQHASLETRDPQPRHASLSNTPTCQSQQYPDMPVSAIPHP